jgi:dGTPase
MLAELMENHGGFEHNRQGLRIIEDLETRYPEFPGLNLTYEVPEAMVKHGAHDDRSLIPDRFHPDESPLMEAQLVDAVDSIVYDCHDIDDGLRGGYITVESFQDVALWRGAWGEAVESCPRGAAQKLVLDRALRLLMGRLIDDLVENSEQRLRDHRIDSLAGLRAHPEAITELGTSMREAKEELEHWLFVNLYRHHRINGTFHAVRRVIRDLFGFFVDHPDALPPEFAARAAGAGLHLSVADYIAGMTDRFALDEHSRLFTPRFGRG